jgi:hypothetical protein
MNNLYDSYWCFKKAYEIDKTNKSILESLKSVVKQKLNEIHEKTEIITGDS